MKNVINYYYGLNIENIHLVNGVYFFDYLDRSYSFQIYNRNPLELNELYILNQKLIKYGYFHTIMINREKSLFTIVDNKCYVLLRLSNVINDQISIYDINFIKVSDLSKLSNLILSNWIELWTLKIDYIESRIEETKLKNSNLMPIYYFFIGLGENAIRYIYDTTNEYNSIIDNDLYVSRRRINCNFSVREYYNPLNLVIDNRVRDISEYIKSMFFNDVIDISLIDEYITGIRLNDYEYSMLMGRILFPSFFFDLEDDKNKIITIDIDKYQAFLADIYFIIKRVSNIKEIRWLIKKM